MVSEFRWEISGTQFQDLYREMELKIDHAIQLLVVTLVIRCAYGNGRHSPFKSHEEASSFLHFRGRHLLENEGSGCVWGSWEDWSSCSQTCGGGKRTRKKYGTSEDCESPRRQEEVCNDNICQGTTTGVMTTETTNIVPPAETTTTTRTTETITSIRAKETTTMIPTRGSTTTVPATETNTPTPTTENSTAVPTTEVITSIPSTTTATTLPSAETINAISTIGEADSTPTTEITQTIPTTEPTETTPMAETTNTIPETETTNTIPTTGGKPTVITSGEEITVLPASPGGLRNRSILLSLSPLTASPCRGSTKIIDLQQTEGMKIDKYSTASAKNKKKSMHDDRTSCKVIGVISCIVVSLPFLLIVFSDLEKIAKDIANSPA